jgi:hypothetical protein
VSNASSLTGGSSLKACRIISSPTGVAGSRQFPVARANNTAGDVRSTLKCAREDPVADPFSFGIIPDEGFLLTAITGRLARMVALQGWHASLFSSRVHTIS